MGFSPKFFYSFRDGDVAYTLQQNSNSFGLFLLLTELKVGGSRRSIIIPVGSAMNGWRVFGLELRKMLEPDNYVNGGSGHLKFVAQSHKDTSGVQPFKSYADTVHGHQVQVRDRLQPYLLSTHGKGNVYSGDNKGEKEKMKEKQNPVLKQRLLYKRSVSFPGSMGSRSRSEVPNLEKTILLEKQRRSPLNFKFNWVDHVFGNKGELGNPDWAGIGLTVEVNGEGKRRVAWKKGGLRSSIWVSKGQREHVVPSGSRDLSHTVVGSVQAQKGLPVTHFPVSTGLSSLVVGVSPTVGVTKPFIQETHTPTMPKAPRLALVAQGDMDVVGFQGEMLPAPSEEAGTACQPSSLTMKSSVGQT